MKEWRNKNRDELPGDPGFLTRLWRAVEDLLLLPRMNDRRTFALVIIALVLLWLVVALSVPGPF